MEKGEKDGNFKDFYNLLIKKEDYELFVWDMTGTVECGYANSFFKFENIQEFVQNSEVENYSLGYDSIRLHIDLKKAKKRGKNKNMRIKREKDVCIMNQRDYLSAENRAYDDLVRAGFYPQGYDFKTNKNLVFRIENIHTSEEVKEAYYFEDWQQARDALVSKKEKKKLDSELDSQIVAVYVKILTDTEHRKHIRSGNLQEVVNDLKDQAEHKEGFGWTNLDSTIITFDEFGRGIVFNDETTVHIYEEIAELLINKYGEKQEIVSV